MIRGRGLNVTFCLPYISPNLVEQPHKITKKGIIKRFTCNGIKKAFIDFF